MEAAGEALTAASVAPEEEAASIAGGAEAASTAGAAEAASTAGAAEAADEASTAAPGANCGSDDVGWRASQDSASDVALVPVAALSVSATEHSSAAMCREGRQDLSAPTMNLPPKQYSPLRELQTRSKSEVQVYSNHLRHSSRTASTSPPRLIGRVRKP